MKRTALNKIVWLILVTGFIFSVSANSKSDTMEYQKLNLKKYFNEKERSKISSSPAGYETVLDDPREIFRSYLKDNYGKFGMEPSLDDIEVTKVRKTPGGTVIYFRQVMDGIPVYLSNSSITINKHNTVTWVNNMYRPAVRKKKGQVDLIKQNSIQPAEAVKIAENYLDSKQTQLSGDSEMMWVGSQDKGVELAWKVLLRTAEPPGTWEIFVNTENGRVINARNIDFQVDGEGLVFDPDPLTTAHVGYGTPYVNSNDADIAELNAERVSVVLRDINKDNNTGLFSLNGPYCEMHDISGHGGSVDIFPELSDSIFNFTRSQQEFESVMCYYHIDLSARELIDYGYYDTGLDNFRIDPHGTSEHNAYFSPGNNWIYMGEGGIDAAEDAGLIRHEYGHAIEHNVGPGLSVSNGEPRAIWEGSSDYWDLTYKADCDTFAWSLAGYWFSSGVGRDADTDLAYPQQRFGYAALTIWSGALMKI